MAASLSAAREQLAEALEELGARDRELSEAARALGRYRGRMQEMGDQVAALYRCGRLCWCC